MNITIECVICGDKLSTTSDAMALQFHQAHTDLHKAG